MINNSFKGAKKVSVIDLSRMETTEEVTDQTDQSDTMLCFDGLTVDDLSKGKLYYRNKANKYMPLEAVYVEINGEFILVEPQTRELPKPKKKGRKKGSTNNSKSRSVERLDAKDVSNILGAFFN